jgi:hypothetical protein
VFFAQYGRCQLIHNRGKDHGHLNRVCPWQVERITRDTIQPGGYKTRFFTDFAHRGIMGCFARLNAAVDYLQSAGRTDTMRSSKNEDSLALRVSRRVENENVNNPCVDGRHGYPLGAHGSRNNPDLSLS